MTINQKWEAPVALRIYVERIGGEILNWRRAMVKVHGQSAQGRNYYVEKTLIKVNDEGDVVLNREAPMEHQPTLEERTAIKAAYSSAEFPHAAKQTHDNAERLRIRLGVPLHKWFVIVSFENREAVIMCQERVDTDDGGKYYRPWTYFSADGRGEWLVMEPGSSLPFWKPPRRNMPQIMVHEGAKAAAHVDWLCFDKSVEAQTARTEHPWYDYLRHWEHWGINGGAMAPHRADYEELRAAKPLRVIYCCDRDHPGESALQKFSEQYRDTMLGLKFDKRFPVNWDMADPIPDVFFSDGVFIGPPLRCMEEPATWATDMVPAGDGGKKLVAVLRQKFKEEWYHVVQPECYININQPTKIYIAAPAFNNRVKPFSHSHNVARLLQDDDAGKLNTLCYAPDCSTGPRVLKDGGHAFNTHMMSDVRPKKGDPEKWLDYMKWLFPIPDDRTEVMRWCATIMARPDIKMNYALLLCSEQQGVGKTTLGQNILGPIVGLHNMKAPSVTEILDSQFTGWKSRCRLILVNEIYEGQSVKAYNRLKSLITDTTIEVNEKFVTPYTIQNWSHILACSNHKNALKLPDDDRRWLVPEVTEELRSDDYWIEFNRWLITGGLPIIAHWAHDFFKKDGEKPVSPAARAPSGAAKARMVQEGWSPGQTLVADWLDRQMEKTDIITVVTDNALIDLIQVKIWEGRHSDRLERPLTVRKIAKARGWTVGEKRIFIAEGKPMARLISNRPPLVDLSLEPLEQLQRENQICWVKDFNGFGM